MNVKIMLLYHNSNILPVTIVTSYLRHCNCKYHHLPPSPTTIHHCPSRIWVFFFWWEVYRGYLNFFYPILDFMIAHSLITIVYTCTWNIKILIHPFLHSINSCIYSLLPTHQITPRIHPNWQCTDNNIHNNYTRIATNENPEPMA